MALKDNAEKTDLEILQERAEVLGRAGEHLSAALRHLDSVERVIESKLHAASGRPPKEHEAPFSSKKGNAERPSAKEVLHEINNEIRRYNEAREFAKLRLYYLIVTREAVGFRRHKSVEEQYPIPPKKKLMKSLA
jgi:transcriptional regulator of met regulon